MKGRLQTVKYQQSCLTARGSSSFFWSVDFDALQLQCLGSDGSVLEESFASSTELERCYRERVVPLFGDPGGCTDLDRGDEASPVSDLVAFARELRACGHDWAELPRVPDDAGEVLVAELATRIRRELNRAFGATDVTLEHVVLLVGEGRIRPAIKDPPALAGASDEQIARIIDGDKSLRWLRGHSLAFSLSHETIAWGDLPSLWADPWQYGPSGLLGAALDLVAVRIEASPQLRTNVSIPRELRIFASFRDSETVLFERRALAREHLGKSALAYFERCGREAR